MVRTPCCRAEGLKKGAWTPEEDQKLIAYLRQHGEGGWRTLPEKAGLKRCGKSCRLRWANYLRPDIKRGEFSREEEDIIIKLHALKGNKWAAIASGLEGRTDNEIKNHWNTHIKKRLLQKGIDPATHKPINSGYEALGNPKCTEPLSQKPTSSSASVMVLNRVASKLAVNRHLLAGIINGNSGKPLPPAETSSGNASTYSMFLNKMAATPNALKSVLMEKCPSENNLTVSASTSSGISDDFLETSMAEFDSLQCLISSSTPSEDCSLADYPQLPFADLFSDKQMSDQSYMMNFHDVGIMELELKGFLSDNYIKASPDNASEEEQIPSSWNYDGMDLENIIASPPVRVLV